MKTAHIAAGGGDGEGPGSGKEMKKGFLLDRIVITGDRFSVDQRVKGAAPVLPHPAYPPAPILDPAVMGAEGAENRAAFQF